MREFRVEIVQKDKDSREESFGLKLSERTRTVEKTFRVEVA